MDALQKVLIGLNENKPVRSLELSEEEKEALALYPFLSQKKVLYVANVSENELPSMENAWVQKVRAYAESEGNSLLAVCAKIEEEVAELPPSDRPAFLQSLGLEESGLTRLIRSSFKMLGLITYLTTGEIETRAWTIREGTQAAEAAGVIHSDLEKGFIRAEVVRYEDMMAAKGRAQAREKGKVRMEGKHYVVQDGDVILFMHNG